MTRTEKITNLGFLKNFHPDIKPGELKWIYIECNTLGLDLELNLYRILSYERLLESLKNQCLYMSKPSAWGDPYELFLLKNKARDSDGSVTNFDEMRNRIYGQCWSTHEESEALWKVHSPDSFKTVRIKSNGNKLMKSFYDINDQCHRQSYFIGRVNYVRTEFVKKTLEDGINKYFNSMEDGVPIIQTLFIKRKAFEYESEVRLVFNDVTGRFDGSKERFSFKIDINEVIDEITFHPELPAAICNEMKAEIRKLGYTTGDINQSTLYKMEDYDVKF